MQPLGTYLVASQYPPLRRKTHLWAILTRRSGAKLGQVGWFSRWRQYCFYAERGTIFNSACLQEISTFLVNQNREHRDKKRSVSDGP